MKAARGARPGTARTLRLGPRASDPGDAFTRSLRRRLAKVLSLLSAIQNEEDPEVVHDLRVWSRRLQQGLDALFPTPRSRTHTKVRRRLRSIRRSLGEWRNLDVVLELLAERRRLTDDRSLRRAWALTIAELRRQRSAEVRDAHRRLSRIDPSVLEHRVRSLIEQAHGAHRQGARTAVGKALDTWTASLERARAGRAEDIHALRIATKRLRYRAELARDLGDPPPEESLPWMKTLQETLGAWHDRQVLRGCVAQALARPQLLLDEGGAVRAALATLEHEAEAEVGEIESLLRNAGDSSVPMTIRAWVAS